MDTMTSAFITLALVLIGAMSGAGLILAMRIYSRPDKSTIWTDPELLQAVGRVYHKLENFDEKTKAPVIITDTETIEEIAKNLMELTEQVRKMAEKRLEVTQTVKTPDGVDLGQMQGILIDVRDRLPALEQRFEAFERWILQIRGR